MSLRPAPAAARGGATIAEPAPVVVVRASWRQASSAVVLALLALALAAAAVWAERELHARTHTTLPVVAPVRIFQLFIDDGPVPLTVTAAWTRVPHVATRDAVLGDATLWVRMHVADWDHVPSPLREQALDAMLVRYGRLLTTPSLWDAMSAHDWDAVPQPVRAFAFRHMVQYWTGYYHVGRSHGLAPQKVSDTAAAIVLTESWFEHRAEHVNRWGNRDVGLAQASDGARRRMLARHASGAIDVRLEDDDYWNPWAATRFVAIWLAGLLDEFDGDLDAAVRAYHRGVANARRGDGQPYLDLVLRRRQQYIRNQGDGSPAWRYLWERDREITRAAWPWLHARQVLSTEPRSPTAQLDRPGDRTPTWWSLALAPAPQPLRGNIPP